MEPDPESVGRVIAYELDWKHLHKIATTDNEAVFRGFYKHIIARIRCKTIQRDSRNAAVVFVQGPRPVTDDNDCEMVVAALRYFATTDAYGSKVACNTIAALAANHRDKLISLRVSEAILDVLLTFGRIYFSRQVNADEVVGRVEIATRVHYDEDWENAVQAACMAVAELRFTSDTDKQLLLTAVSTCTDNVCKSMAVESLR